MKRGFTLVEIMIAFAILTSIVVGVAAIYRNIAGLSGVQKEEAERNTDISITCTMIKKDIEMAGFATPDIIRFASDNRAQDTFFIADGWEIMTDYTDNGYADGTISDIFYGRLSQRSLGGGGYAGVLRNDAGIGATFIEILNCDINQGPRGTDSDFRRNASLITSEDPPQGYRITSIDCVRGSISIQPALRNPVVANSQVAPAICYHIQDNWLFRNSERVIENAVNLQVEYGFDLDGNRLLTENNPDEWIDQLPRGHNPQRLRAIRVHLAIRPDSRIPKLVTYTISSELRN